MASRISLICYCFLVVVVTATAVSGSVDYLRFPGLQSEEAHREGRRPSAAHDDMIKSLPGAPEVSFRMHSGYVTVDETNGRALFYWFVESVRKPWKNPLTLWLNGGPGCSSVGGGMLSELGPFFPDKSGDSLRINPDSWNLVSNLIFLESPAGVGFSYSNTSSDYVVGDERTASDALAFLVGFFRRFPRYAGRDFYIAGESYGGHYVPQLAAAILKHNDQSEKEKINLQGFMAGNPWTDAVLDNKGAALYWWSHAIISEETYHGMLNTCNMSHVGPLASAANDECDDFINRAGAEMGAISIYDIYTDVCLPAHAAAETSHFLEKVHMLGRAGKRQPTNHALNVDPCVDDEVETYLNQEHVQRALHANTTGIPYRWTDCSIQLTYSMDDLFTSVLPLYKELLKKGLKIMIYSGDVDAIVPVTGTRAWVASLGLGVKAPWRPYTIFGQVAGYVVEYDGLTFATVRDAGHMVPYTQKRRALHLFSSFIRDHKL